MLAKLTMRNLKRFGEIDLGSTDAVTQGQAWKPWLV